MVLPFSLSYCLHLLIHVENLAGRVYCTNDQIIYGITYCMYQNHLTNLYLIIVTLSTYIIYRFVTVCRRIKIIELSPFFRKKLFLVNNERKRKYKIRIQMKRWTHTKETLSVLMFWDMGLLYAISLALMFLSIRKYFPR